MTEFDRMQALAVPVPTSKQRAEEAFFKFAATLARIEAAAARTKPNPTAAERESGRYRKGRAAWKGLTLVIETAAGETRKPEWPALKDHYGYVEGTESGADGDPVDVFVCDEHPDSELVFVVNQRKKDGTFDEGKCVIGCITERDAVACYLRNYSPGWKGMGSIVPLTLPQFKTWLKDGDTSRPIRDSDVSVKTGAARPAAAAGVPGLAPDERAVLQHEKQEVRLLRGEGHHSLSKMAGQLLGVLRGHGAEAGRYGAGPSEERQELHPGELSVGNVHGSVEKQAERAEVHVQWPHLDFAAVGGSRWYSTDHSADAAAAVRLDARAGVHDTGQRPEEKLADDLVSRANAAAASVGRGNGHLAGDDRQPTQQGVVSGTGASAVKTADARVGLTCPHCGSTKTGGARATERHDDGRWGFANVACSGCGNGFGYDEGTGQVHTLDTKPERDRSTPKSGFDGYEPALVLVKRAAANDDHPFTICVDFDGTLAEAEEPFDPKTCGKPRGRALKWLRLFHKAGARIIIFTVRGDTEPVEEFCEANDAPYDFINENPDQPPGSSGKVFADAYWDDRAFNAEDPDEHGPEILRRVMARGGEPETGEAGCGPAIVISRQTVVTITGPSLLAAMEDDTGETEE